MKSTLLSHKLRASAFKLDDNNREIKQSSVKITSCEMNSDGTLEQIENSSDNTSDSKRIAKVDPALLSPWNKF